MDHIFPKKVFLAKNTKHQQHHWVLHIQLSLQSFTKDLRQTLVSMQNSALQEKFNFCFSRGFYCHNFHFGWRTEHWTIIVWNFEIFLIFSSFLKSKVFSRLATRYATRVYQFITNNHASFQLWWKENLLSH